MQLSRENDDALHERRAADIGMCIGKNINPRGNHIMDDQLKNIHLGFRDQMVSRYSLQPVSLKHPFPERPLRALGIIKIDGSVHETDKLMRVMVLTTNFLTRSRCSRSIFLGPRPEFYLPIFSSETILMGAKRAFLVDIHPTVRQERWSVLNIEERLLAIRNRYPELLAKPLTLKGKINDIMSKAYCYVEVPPELDGQALSLFNEYLHLFLALVDAAAPVPADEQKKPREDFEAYHQTVINHDPAVKLYSVLFGKTGGIERVNDLFFAK